MAERDDTAFLTHEILARDRLIGALGHELRNAIAPLVLVSDARRDDPALTQNVARLVRVIERVDEVSRLRRYRETGVLVQFDLCTIVTESVESLAQLARDSSIKVFRAGVDTLPMYGDADTLGRAFQHVLDNAIRHSGGANVIVLVEPYETRARISVLDDGDGLGPVDRTAIFQVPAQREPNRHGGFGIGLWVAHTMCTQLGGTLELVPSATGACFRIEAPIRST